MSNEIQKELIVDVLKDEALDGYDEQSGHLRMRFGACCGGTFSDKR